MPSGDYLDFMTGQELRDSGRIRPGVSAAEIAVRWDREGKECDFVPCSLDEPDYVSMTEAETEYYFYWRSMARKGKFLKTSKGYLFLLTAEIINTEKGAKENLKLLTNAVKVYGNIDAFLIDNMADACMTYAKINGLKEPELGRAWDFTLVSYELTRALQKQPIGRISQRVISRIMYASDSTYLDNDHPYSELLTFSLRRIEEQMVQAGSKRLIDSFGSLTRTQYPVYKNFPYFGSRSRSMVVTLDFSHGRKVRDFLRATMKTLLRIVRTSENLSAPLPVQYPTRMRYTIRECVREWRAKEWRPEELDMKEFELDISSIRSAKEDLDAVSEMMYIPDDVGEETVSVKEEMKKPASDPWTELSNNLDDKQKDYLSASLEGDVRSVLKKYNMRMAAMEESINSIAMDTVGDTIVEDGEPVEDYIEEIRRAIG